METNPLSERKPEGAKRVATLKDVAKLAGVSPSTVSRTLSNRIFVEEETRGRVMKAVEALHYHPSITARALREGKSYTLALLMPDINNFFYPEVMKNIEKYASEYGYTILLCNNNESIEKEKKAALLVSGRGVDGILCLSVSDDVAHLAQLQKEQGIPVVLVNRPETETVSSVRIDNEYGGYLMTKYLLGKGHTKIAGVFSNFDRERFRSRYYGCKRALEEAGISDYKRFFIYDVNSLDEAYERTREMLSRNERPTAFFATMDVLTIGIYSGIMDSGCRIPNDISVVGFDDIFMTKYMLPPLTTYHISIDKLAKQAVELLLERIEKPEMEARGVILRGSLKERSSVKAMEHL